MTPDLRSKISLRNPVHFLALGFGSGLAGKMPGTFGTLAALPLVIYLSFTLDLNAYVAVTAIASVMGIWLCGQTANDMCVHDDSAIVWDEVAGMLITMVAVPLSWQSVLIGFVVFRFYDIVKPWPISFIDKHIHGGFGIMLDDVMAGIAAFATMHLFIYLAWI